jgi:hypothetical protein
MKNISPYQPVLLSKLASDEKVIAVLHDWAFKSRVHTKQNTQQISAMTSVVTTLHRMEEPRL